MEQFFRLLLSPMAFAIGFLWPFFTQSLVALGYVEAGINGLLAGAVIAIAFGLVAQFRGSWIWIR